MGLPIPTGLLAPKILVVRDWFVNFFLIKAGNGVVCIDSGWRARGTLRGLKLLGFEPDQVKAVLLTHTDWDHAGGLDCLNSAGIYAGAGLEHPPAGRQKKFYRSMKAPGERRSYSLVKGGDTLDFGDVRVEVMNTAGHTEDSLSYLVFEEWLFTGDAAWIFGEVSTGPRLINRDNYAARNSLDSIMSGGKACWLVTSHTGIWKIKQRQTESNAE